jgi:hypothetical protein
MMSLKSLGSIALLALASLTAPPAWTAQPASLIIHGAILNPWTIEIQRGGLQYGKIKIFTREPQFDDDNDLKNSKEDFTELRSDRDGPTTFTLDWKAECYWILFYPKLGRLNLDLKLYKGKDSSPAIVTVTQGIIAKPKGIAGGIFTAGLTFLGSASGLPIPTDISGALTLNVAVKPGGYNLDNFDYSKGNFEKFGGTAGLKSTKENAFLILN